MRVARTRTGLLGTFVIVGCAHAPAVDPRAQDRARLEALGTTPLPADFAAEARLVLSPRLVAAEVQQSLDEAAGALEAFRFALPLLGEVTLQPDPVVRGVRAEPEPRCVGRVALLVELDGALAPVTTSGVRPTTSPGRSSAATDVTRSAHRRAAEPRSVPGRRWRTSRQTRHADPRKRRGGC
ncbi:MAG: hypothetical protein FJ137_04510 [Deltaproteobacteria bacterium]|nr:hypothetical protein [Deltaproteobacteria bacterium]